VGGRSFSWRPLSTSISLRSDATRSKNVLSLGGDDGKGRGGACGRGEISRLPHHPTRAARFTLTLTLFSLSPSLSYSHSLSFLPPSIYLSLLPSLHLWARREGRAGEDRRGKGLDSFRFIPREQRSETQSHIATLITYKLSSRKITTHNDLHY